MSTMAMHLPALHIDDGEHRMFKYEYSINSGGQITKDVFECGGNEDAKREVMRRLKALGVPAGKYVFVDITRLDDNKPIIEEELWRA
jgi:hypothetical protein